MALASELIIACARTYGDAGMDRLDEATWRGHLTNALRQVVLVRPDANAVRMAIPLVPGMEQALPDGSGELPRGVQLIGVHRNMGADGQTPGQPVTQAAEKDIYLAGGWGEAAGAYVAHYAWDEKTPAFFQVWPPVPSGGLFVLASFSVEPVPVAAMEQAIGLAEIYVNPVMEWMLHLAFREDTESAVNQGRASGYWNAFFASLGVKTQRDAWFRPKGGEG